MDTLEVTKIAEPQVIEAEISRELGDCLDAVAPLCVIKTEEDRARAVAAGVGLKTKLTGFKALREKMVKPIYRAYENARDLFDDRIKAVEAGMTALRNGISAFDVEKERQARLEREKQEAERRRQEEEHKKLLAAHQLEVDHYNALLEYQERVKKAREEADAREKARKIKEEEDARLKQAQEAHDLGMGDRVGAILSQTTPIAPETSKDATGTAMAATLTPLPPPPPPPPPPAPVAAVPAMIKRADPNTISKDVWVCEIIDLMALVKAVAAGIAPIEYLEAKMPEIRKDVKRLKDEYACPGVRAWKERETAFRAMSKQ